MRRRLPGLAVLAGVLVLVARAYERWWFPRDPERRIDGSARMVAPADGRVVYVVEVEEGMAPIAVKQRRAIPLDEIAKGEERPPAGVLLGRSATWSASGTGSA